MLFLLCILLLCTSSFGLRVRETIDIDINDLFTFKQAEYATLIEKEGTQANKHKESKLKETYSNESSNVSSEQHKEESTWPVLMKEKGSICMQLIRVCVH